MGHVKTTVGGRELTLSNLDKVLYPDVGLTKGEVIDYYARIAPVMLPHLAGRPLTLKRYPDGVEGKSFFEKHVPRSAPSWVETVKVPSSGGRSTQGFVEHPVVNDLPTLLWAANLASLELHVPMWRVGRGELPRPPDLMVFDLDPGAPASVVECCGVALEIAKHLKKDDLVAFPKSSGSKGLQLYVPLPGRWRWENVGTYAHSLADMIAERSPEQVVAKMAKALRGGKVFIDWSQNTASKTTIAPYSLRARATPTVSTPVRWSEVRGCLDSGDPTQLSFDSAEVLARVDKHGDLFAPSMRQNA